jgi:hypothetical protein
MSTQEHIAALRQKHAHLEKMVCEETTRPQPDDVRLHELKREKLRLKDEIAALSVQPLAVH